MCNVSNRSSSVLCFTKRKKGKDLVDYMKNKYGEENVLEEICPKCSKKFKCFSAGIYEDAILCPCLHLFANWNIFGSGHALLLQSFLFQNAISHMFYSNFPSFTPSINI